ncbi:MAG: hypothetical protein KAY24_03575 [Candidatus Eisenbacteria sp.]|nr:hypothetical protein [Candidatus Eisenbacteria bacterium]
MPHDLPPAARCSSRSRRTHRLRAGTRSPLVSWLLSAGLRICCIGLLCPTLITPASGEQPGTWGGRIQVIDGLTHVYNPATPLLAPLTVPLEPVWSRGGDDEEDELFGRLVDATRDEVGNIYLLDEQMHQVLVYSPEGELLGTMGREGEGPGEFQRPRSVFLVPGGLVGVAEMMPARIIQFHSDGVPAGEVALDFLNPEGGGRLMLSAATSGASRLIIEVAHRRRSEGIRSTDLTLAAISHEGNLVCTYLRRHDQEPEDHILITDRNLTFERGGWTLLADGRLCARLQREAYEIGVFSADGSLERIIHRKGLSPLKRTQEELEELEERSVQIRGGRHRRRTIRMDFAPTKPMILALQTGPENQLWVRTCRHAQDLPEGILERIEVFDGAGRFKQELLIQTGRPLKPARSFYVGHHLILFGAGMGIPAGEEEGLPGVSCYRMLLGP